MGLNGGGSETIFSRFLLVTEASSRYVSKRSINGCKYTKAVNESQFFFRGRYLLLQFFLLVEREDFVDGLLSAADLGRGVAGGCGGGGCLDLIFDLVQFRLDERQLIQ